MKIKRALFTVIIAVIIGFGYLSYVENHQNNCNEDISIEENDPYFMYFKEQEPDKKILLCIKEDLDEDKVQDLIIIYKEDASKNHLVVIRNIDDSYLSTIPILAPIDNQKITFKDIDEKAPLEFIVSGSKNGKYGYAIYRLEDNQLLDLFGEGMEDCC